MDEENEKGYRWETEYEKTWEQIKEGDDGLITASVDEIVRKAKKSNAVRRNQIRLGMMRHVFVVIDLSDAMLALDMKPLRITVTLKVVEQFVKQFFDQNPISQIGLITTYNKRANKVCPLTGSLDKVLSCLSQVKPDMCLGEPSLQNAVEMGMSTLRNLPKYTSREILVIMGSLTTCDPSDIQVTIDNLVKNNIRCSIVGLSAEVNVFKTMAKRTKGAYIVVLDEHHFKEMVLQQLQPPPSSQGTQSSLIKMGFPTPMTEVDPSSMPSMCVCHLDDPDAKISRLGYFCPQCNSKYCDLPADCRTCGLPLISSAHLARSYHHLFPVQVFEEAKHEGDCISCLSTVSSGFICPRCAAYYCTDCDNFIHESLHICPGCAATREEVS